MIPRRMVVSLDPCELVRYTLFGIAGVAELADAHDSKSCSLGSVGSIPTFGTRIITFSPRSRAGFFFQKPTWLDLFLETITALSAKSVGFLASPPA